MSADGFESADMIQQFELRGYHARRLSVDKAPSLPYKFAKMCINEGRLCLPDDHLLIEELTRLIEDRRLEKVDHPANFSKDISDALVGSCYSGLEWFKKNRSYNLMQYKDLLATINVPTPKERTPLIYRPVITASAPKPKSKPKDIYDNIDTALFNTINF
jgi:hypothetical protein